MSGQGSTVGGKFCELKSIIDRVRDQSRVGVCLDTCHAFAAGYDLSAEGGVKAMLSEFDQEVGLQYLKAFHLNDSKGRARTITQIITQKREFISLFRLLVR